MKLEIKGLVPLSIFAALAIQSQVLANEDNLLKNGKVELGSVEVVGSSLDEEKGSYTIESMNTSTKLDLSIRRTPQTISVKTAQELQDKGIRSFQDMIGSVTGVSINRWDERIYPTARGFDIDYYKIDGMPTYSTLALDDIDLSMFERVEVVKGANGLTTGAGNPALSINLVRKRANSKELKGDFSISAGSWNAYTALADISTPINEDGSVRGRIVAKYQNEDSFMSDYHKENKMVYGVVDADLTDSSYLSLGFSYQAIDRDNIRWGGLPAFYSDGTRTDFDRSTTVSEDWTYWNAETKTAFLDFKQKLFDDVSLNFSYSYMDMNLETSLLYFAGAINRANGSGLNYMDYADENRTKEHNFDTYINAPFELGGLLHEVIAGVTYNKSELVDGKAAYPSGGYNPLSSFYSYNLLQQPAILSPLPTNETEQKGIYLSGNFSLRDDLKLIAGARLTNWEYKSSDNNGNREFKNELTPYMGLVFDLNDTYSVYGSYTSIFNPQSAKDISGSYLDPIEGKNYEMGIKGEYFDGRLNAALSVFRIEQDNVAQAIDGVYVINSTEAAYKAADGVTSKGLELELSGKVTDNLDIDFGIANFDAKDKDGQVISPKSSRTTANIFAKYRVNNKLNLGAGLDYKGKFYTGSGATLIVQEAYVTSKLMASYKINNTASLQLNVDNLFDKKYYAGIGNNGMVYGKPRSAMVTLKYNF